MYQAFLIKYAEIAIKGKNRYLFEDALVSQINHALKKVDGEFKVRKEQGRIYVDCLSEYDFDGELAIVCNESHGYYNSRCGIINMKNEFIVSPIYSYSEIQKIKKQKFN